MIDTPYICFLAVDENFHRTNDLSYIFDLKYSNNSEETL